MGRLDMRTCQRKNKSPGSIGRGTKEAAKVALTFWNDSDALDWNKGQNTTTCFWWEGSEFCFELGDFKTDVCFLCTTYMERRRKRWSKYKQFSPPHTKIQAKESIREMSDYKGPKYILKLGVLGALVLSSLDPCLFSFLKVTEGYEGSKALGLPWSSVVRMLSFHCQGLGLIPGQGTKIPPAT